jgi:hypothetical protein
MTARHFQNISALFLATVFSWIAVRPAAAAAPAALPGFDKFVKTVANGKSGLVRGVYVPDVLALRVAQQPAGSPAFVSNTAGVATQFQMAAQHGVIGLLSHNYAGGAQFSGLSAGDEVRIVYGDGRVKIYNVSAVFQYQALEPGNPRGDLIDLSTGARVTAGDVFAAMYSGGDRVTFQTCIAKDGNLSWGRLFVVAEPAE